MMLLNRRDHWTWKQTICINIQVGLWTGSYSCLISLFPLNRRALQTRFYCFSDKYILTSKAAAKKFSRFHFSFCWKSFFTLLLFFFFFGTHTNPLLMYHALTNTYRCSCIHIVCVHYVRSCLYIEISRIVRRTLNSWCHDLKCLIALDTAFVRTQTFK